jgi:hypothetical protein
MPFAVQIRWLLVHTVGFVNFEARRVNDLVFVFIFCDRRVSIRAQRWCDNVAVLVCVRIYTKL